MPLAFKVNELLVLVSLARYVVTALQVIVWSDALLLIIVIASPAANILAGIVTPPVVMLMCSPHQQRQDYKLKFENFEQFFLHHLSNLQLMLLYMTQ